MAIISAVCAGFNRNSLKARRKSCIIDVLSGENSQLLKATEHDNCQCRSLPHVVEKLTVRAPNRCAAHPMCARMREISFRKRSPVHVELPGSLDTAAPLVCPRRMLSL